MKRLIWKELVEQRYIPFAYAVLLTVILAIWDVMGNWAATHGGSPGDRMTMDNALIILTGGLLVTGLFPGSNTIANESAQGTIGFLSMMPIGRAKIWMSKVIAGIVIMVASAAFMLVAFVAITFLEFHGEAITAIAKIIPFGHVSFGLALLLGIAGMLTLLIISLYSYSISLFCSTIADRPLAAAGLAVCIGLGLIWGMGTAPFDQGFAIEAGLTASVAFFLLSSWFSFCRNVELNAYTRRRTIIWTVSALCLVISMISGVFFYLQSLVELSVPQLESSYYPIPRSFYPPNYKAGQVTYTIKYRRARIGMTSSGLLPIGNSWQIGDRPVSFQSNSPSLTGQISEQTVQLSLGRKHEKPIQRTVYNVLYTYRPALPYGDETLVLNALSARGNVIGSIYISAHKARGYFPHRGWFYDLYRGTGDSFIVYTTDSTDY